MTRNEQQMYSDITSIRKSLEKIANALDNNVTQTTKDIPGFEGTLDALDNLKGSNLPSLTKQEMLEEDDVQNDYLNDLVQGMNQIEFLQFHSSMNFSFASNDSTAMSDAIYELEYEECLGAIEIALLITGDRDYISAIASTGGIAPHVAGRKYVIEQLVEKEDEYTYEPNPNRDKGEPALIEYLDGIKNDSDYDVRVDAEYYGKFLSKFYNNDNLSTKKDCILEYVTKAFRNKGARYTDIIKFAYYLGAPNAPKYTSENRGYYSCAFSSRMNGHLIQGGKDYLVKGINNEGKERYFALSNVESFTDYYKRIS